MEAPGLTKSPEQVAVDEATKRLDLLRATRQDMIDNLVGVAEATRIDENDSGALREAKLATFSTLDGALKSQEANIVNTAKIQLQQKAVENDGLTAAAVTGILEHITLSKSIVGTPTLIDAKADDELEKRCTIDIEATELEEIKTD